MKLALIATVCLLACGCATLNTMESAAASFHEQVKEGKVKELGTRQHFQLRCSSPETATTKSGLKCLIIHVWPNETDLEFKFLLVQLPGEKQWRMSSFDELDKKPLTTIPEVKKFD